jgi:C4-dicarboxylate-specific signal transduction histidine kinase
MSTMWAQRREELLSDCLVSPEVFTPLIDRLVEFVVPEAARSEMGVRLFNELQLLRDLNERHELEKAKQALEERYREVEMELAHANRVTAMGQLAASITHEVMQPLGAMVNNASACVRWLAAQNLEEAQRSAALALGDDQRAADISCHFPPRAPFAHRKFK